MNDSTTRTTRAATPGNVELTYHSGAIAWLAVVRNAAGAIVETVAQSPDPLLAADDGLATARRRNVPLVVPDYLRDSLICQWHVRGMALYQADLPIHLCANAYERDGWLACYEDDGPALANERQFMVNWDSDRQAVPA